MLALIICSLLMNPAHAAPKDLLPVPARIQVTKGFVPLKAGFGIALRGAEDSRLRAAAQRFLERTRTASGVTGEIRNEKEATLVIEAAEAGRAAQSWQEDESYRLRAAGRTITLRAPNPLGVIRGLETLTQLVEAGQGSARVPAVAIEDRPRFAWRGLLLDSCRHWLPVEAIYRTLEGMAAVKMNVLHWHLSDDQGFRFESRVYPKLHEQGSDGKFYTQEQIRAVVAFARERGIRVIPEFDVPGHSTSWFVGHPELASLPGSYAIERAFGVFDPSLDPTRESTYEFLDRLFGEVAGLFPDEYFHIGGDEVTGRQWDQSPAIQEFKRARGFAANHDLQTYFNSRVLQILTRHGKKMAGWDEILHPGLPLDVAVQSWRGTDSLVEAARRGYAGVMSFGYYLDHMLPASLHYQVDPLPAGHGLTPAQQKLILGGEACIWAEYVTAENLDSRIWPRAGAIAERLWSPRATRDLGDLYRRLPILSERLEKRGLGHRRERAAYLARLVAPEGLPALEILADVVEPVKFIQRRSRPYTSLTALDHLVDALPAEAEGARLFARDVAAWLRDRRNARLEASLRERLTRWRDNDPALKPFLERSPVAADILPVSRDLGLLGLTGLEALEYVTGRKTPNVMWLEKARYRLVRTHEAKADVHQALADALRPLIEAVRLPRE
jgi:hexosaminidase